MNFERKEKEEIKKIIGYSIELGFSIQYNGEQVGNIFLSELMTGGYLVEWIEIFPEHQRNGYLKRILMDVMDYLEIDEIQLESNEELISMYLHLGAKKLDYDNIRDMYLLKLNKRAEKRREK